MGHLSPNHQWDVHRCSMFLLTPVWARGIGISFRVRHRHLPYHRQVREARLWVEVGDMAHMPGLRGPKGVSAPLHRRLRWQISRLYRVCFYSRAYGQEDIV